MGLRETLSIDASGRAFVSRKTVVSQAIRGQWETARRSRGRAPNGISPGAAASRAHWTKTAGDARTPRNS